MRQTWTIELEPVEPEQGDQSFAPGQFAMLYVFGVGEVPISFSGDPARSTTLVHTVRAVGAVTRALCALRMGDAIGVRGPFGSRWPIDEAIGHDVVLVAGGLGLAPLRPALYALLAARRRYGRVALLYGSRTPQDLLYRRDLERWRGRFDLQVEVAVDSARGDWYGHVGVVTALIPRVPFDPTSTTAMICGPEIMMRFTAQDLLRRGVAPENIFLSMERHMQCAVGFCGHCQFGPAFICKDGPVLRYARIEPFFSRREV